MIRFIIVLALILTLPMVSKSQSVSLSDSSQIVLVLQELFKSSATNHFSEFKKISSSTIYCLICEKKNGSNPEHYLFSRKEFFNNNLNKIVNSDLWKRAQISDEIIYYKEPSVNEQYSSITVLFTILKENEYADGHEGAQLAFYFKKIKGHFKFAGLETIP